MKKWTTLGFGNKKNAYINPSPTNINKTI